MADHPPAPCLDEIVTTAPPRRCLCNSREHTRLGFLADVIVTFGHLGTLGRDALWPQCWGQSYPLCTECWDTVRQIAASRRPSLVITNTTSAPPQPLAPAASPPSSCS